MKQQDSSFPMQSLGPVEEQLERFFPESRHLYTAGSVVAVPDAIARHYGSQKIAEERFPQEYWKLGTYRLPNSKVQRRLELSLANVEEIRSYLDDEMIQRFTPNQLRRYILSHADFIFKTKSVRDVYDFMQTRVPERGLPDLNRVKDGQIGMELMPFILTTNRDRSFTEDELRNILALSQQTFINPIRAVQVSHSDVIVNATPRRPLAAKFNDVANSSNSGLNFEVPPPKHPLFFPNLADKFANLYSEGIEESFERMNVIDQQKFFNQYYKPYYDRDAFASGLEAAMAHLLGTKTREATFQEIRRLNELHLLNKDKTSKEYDLARLWFFDWPYSSNLSDIDKPREMFSGYVVEQFKLYDANAGRVSTVDFIIADPTDRQVKKVKLTVDKHTKVDALEVEACNLVFGHRAVGAKNTTVSRAQIENTPGLHVGHVDFDAAESKKKHVIQPFDVGANDEEEEQDIADLQLDDDEEDINTPSLANFLQNLLDKVTQTLNKHLADLTTTIQYMDENLFIKYQQIPDKVKEKKKAMRALFKRIGVELTKEDMDGGYDAYRRIFGRYKQDMDNMTKLLNADIDSLRYYLAVERPELATAALALKIKHFTHEKQQQLVDKLKFILHNVLGIEGARLRFDLKTMDQISASILRMRDSILDPIFTKLANLKKRDMLDDSDLYKLLEKGILFTTEKDVENANKMARIKTLIALLEDANLEGLDEDARKAIKSAKKKLQKGEQLSLKKLANIEASMLEKGVLKIKKKKSSKSKDDAAASDSKEPEYTTLTSREDLSRQVSRQLTTDIIYQLVDYIDDQQHGLIKQLADLADPNKWVAPSEEERPYFEAYRKARRNAFIRSVEKTLLDMEAELSSKEQLIAVLQSSLRLILGVHTKEFPAHIYPTQENINMMLADTILRPSRMQELIEKQQRVNRDVRLRFKNFGDRFDHQDDESDGDSDSDSDSDSGSSSDDDDVGSDFEIEIQENLREADDDDDDDDSSSDDESESVSSLASSTSSVKLDEEELDIEIQEVLDEIKGDRKEDQDDDQPDTGFFETMDFSALSLEDLKDPAAFYVVNQVCFHIACIVQNDAMIALSDLFDELFKRYHVVSKAHNEDASFPTRFVEDLIEQETNQTIKPLLARIRDLIKDESKEMLVYEKASEAALGLAWQNYVGLDVSDLSYRCLHALHQYIVHMFLKPRTEDNVNQAIAYLESIYDFGQLLYLASALVTLRSTQYVELPVPFGDHLYSVLRAHAKRKDGDRGQQLWKDVKRAMKDSSALEVYQSVYHNTGFGRQKETEQSKEVVSKVFTMINPLGEIEKEPIYEEKVRSAIMNDPNAALVALIHTLKDHGYIGDKVTGLIKNLYMNKNVERRRLFAGVKAPFGLSAYAEFLTTLSFMYGHSHADFMEDARKTLEDIRKSRVSRSQRNVSSPTLNLQLQIYAREVRDSIRAIVTGLMVLLPVFPVYEPSSIQDFMVRWMEIYREFQNVLDVINRDNEGLIIKSVRGNPKAVVISFDESHPSDKAVQPGSFDDETQFFTALKKYFTLEWTSEDKKEERYVLKIEDQPQIPEYVFQNELPEVQPEGRQSDRKSSVNGKPLAVYMDQSKMVRFFLQQLVADLPDDRIRSTGRSQRNVKTGYKSLVRLTMKRMNAISAEVSADVTVTELKRIFPPANNYYLVNLQSEIVRKKQSSELALVLSIAIDTMTGLFDRSFVIQGTADERRSGVVEALKVMLGLSEEEADNLLAGYLTTNTQNEGVRFLKERAVKKALRDGLLSYESMRALRPIYRITSTDNLIPTGWQELEDLMIVYDDGTHFIVIVPHRSTDYVWARGNTHFSKEERKRAKALVKEHGITVGLKKLASGDDDDDDDDDEEEEEQKIELGSDGEGEIPMDEPSPAATKRKSTGSPESQPAKKKGFGGEAVSSSDSLRVHNVIYSRLAQSGRPNI